MSAPAPRRRAPRGVRREMPALLAGTLLVFVALATFTLLSYRAAIDGLESERVEEARRTATRLAGGGRRPDALGAGALAAALPPGAAVAILDSSGRALDAFGFAAPADLVPLPEAALAAPVAFGPGRFSAGAVVALAPFAAGGERRVLRVDLPARALAAQRGTLRLLTPSVILLSIGAALLLAGIARALTRPVDQLLERAQSVGGEAAAGDEIEFLLATFDRALSALGGEPGDDLARLHDQLGRQVESGLLLLGHDGSVLAVNPVAAGLLGLAAPAPEAPLATVLAAHPELAARLAAAVASGAGIPRGEVALERGGVRRVLGLVAEPLRGPAGEPRGFLVLFADITDLERRAARDRLEDGLAQLGELAAGAAHELRNSVAALGGWLDLARRRDADPEGYLAEMHAEVGRLRRVLDDFLLFARPGTRRLEAVDLGALVARACRGPWLEGMPVALALPPAPVAVAGDEELLERALRNLLVNAAQAERRAGREGPLEVALERTEAGIRFAVADRGPGIPAELRDRLFRPFASGRPEGAGLGLALCRRIALLHGGRVELVDRPGGGTVATLELPADILVTEGNEPGLPTAGSEPGPEAGNRSRQES